MTRKRKLRKKNKYSLKQKKLLETRLLRINMVIEAYLYNNQQISVHEATSYIEEVSSYRVQCADDARSFSVIEKIIRCMKAIIAEQQESRNGVSETVTSENSCPSPVYSLPDEDRKHTQNANEAEVAEIVSLSDIDDDPKDHNIQVDVEVHRAMSNLSIREEIINQSCSQSILEHFEPNSILNKNETSNQDGKDTLTDKPCDFKIKQIINTNDVTFPVPKLLHKLNQSVNTNCGSTNENVKLFKANGTGSKLESKVNNKIQDKIQKPNPLRKVQFQDDDVVIIDQLDQGSDKSMLKDKAKKTAASKRNIKNKKPEDVKKKKLEKTTEKHRKIRNNKSKKPVEIPLNFPNETLKPILKQNATANNSCMKIVFQEAPISLNVSPPINNILCPLNRSMGKIYDKNVENDLSWLENIRYVREVGLDESDATFTDLGENFWNIFDIPSQWSDKDFDN